MKQQINFKSLLVIICLLLSFNLQAQDLPPVTINVATAGTLSSLISSSKKYLITDLTLTGNLNGTDICYIREMAGCNYQGSTTEGKLAKLNLENAKIVAGGDNYFSSYNTYDNSISSNIFRNLKNLTSIILPNSATTIGKEAFSDCTGLKSITIGNNVTSIDNLAFFYCSGLTSVVIGNSVASIGEYAFEGCIGLTTVTIPNSVVSIGKSVFYDCTGLKSITIGNSVASIGNGAFHGCIGLISVNIPSSVTSIGYYVFVDCTGLKEIIVSKENSNYTDIDGVLFNKDKTQILAYPSAKSATFYSIPNSVTSIGGQTFHSCAGLTSITIPNSVTSIGVEVFIGCKGLKEIHCKAITPPSVPVDSYSFEGITATCKLYVPKGAYSSYWITTGWGDFTNIIEEESTAITQTKASNIKVYTEQDAIVIKGAKLGAEISVYTESGALLQSTKVIDDVLRINIPCGHTYLIKTIDKTVKVAL